MEEKTPLISVIIPLFNREELIQKTLDSVLAQTYSNWECIIVDDCSTDKSYSVAQNYEYSDNRFKVFKRESEPKGAPSCREIGTLKTKGELLIYLDSDDLLAPWSLEERVNHFISNPNLDVLLSNGLQFNSKENKLLDYTTFYNNNHILDFFLRMNVVFQTTSPTWKRELLEKYNLTWDPNLKSWQDVDFAIQAFSNIPNYKWASETPDYFVRKDNDPSAITSLTDIVSKVVSNFYTYEKWLANDMNRQILEKYFPDYMLRKLEFLLPKKDLEKMIYNHSDILKKHLGYRSILYLKLYNKTRNIKFIRGIVYRLRTALTNIQRDNTLKLEYKFNEKIELDLMNKLKEFNSNILKNLGNA